MSILSKYFTFWLVYLIITFLGVYFQQCVDNLTFSFIDYYFKHSSFSSFHTLSFLILSTSIAALYLLGLYLIYAHSPLSKLTTVLLVSIPLLKSIANLLGEIDEFMAPPMEVVLNKELTAFSISSLATTCIILFTYIVLIVRAIFFLYRFSRNRIISNS